MPARTVPVKTMPAAVYWGQDVFVIPYRWSAATDEDSAGRVILYRSTDRGGNWSEVMRARPSVRSFLYRAQQDGEYWFAVRTLDNTGRLWPAGGFEPGLRVVVDTAIPRLNGLVGRLDSAGTLAVACSVSDANLDPSTVTLAVRHAGLDDWAKIDSYLAPTGVDGAFSLRGTWQAPPGVRRVSVRLAVQDLARNPAGAFTVIDASDTPAATPSGPGLAINRPAAPGVASSARPAGPEYQAIPAGRGAASGPESTDPFLKSSPFLFPANAADASAAPPPVPGLAERSATTAEPQPWPADRIAAAPFAPARPEAWSPRDAVADPATPRARSAAGSPFRAVSDSVGGAAPAEGAGQPLVVGDRRFALQYDLESAGRWGVSKVQVWGTRDGGGTWRLYADDADKQSPVQLTVSEEGRYGFRILVQGVGGLPVDPPASGVAPELLVDVDTSPPAAEITSVMQGEGFFGDHLNITWRVDDANLGPGPVTLAYSDRPSGPWQTFASGLGVGEAGRGEGRAGGGRYAWRLQRHVPRTLYIRLEARDRAGNVTTDQTARPVTVRFSQPSGRLRGAG
ncbi:MAG: hypothetical protein AAF790_03440 [Planctomycetota bacterium]